MSPIQLPFRRGKSNYRYSLCARLKSQDAACLVRTWRQHKWGFCRGWFQSTDIVHWDHLPLTVSTCQRSCFQPCSNQGVVTWLGEITEHIGLYVAKAELCSEVAEKKFILNLYKFRQEGNKIQSLQIIIAVVIWAIIISEDCGLVQCQTLMHYSVLISTTSFSLFLRLSLIQKIKAL